MIDIIRNDGMLANSEEIKDAGRFREVAAKRGCIWSVGQALNNWEELSDDYSAGWLIMPQTDSGLWVQWEDFLDRKEHMKKQR